MTKSAEEWADHLHVRANVCSYKEHDRWLKTSLSMT